jgi:hypothetical protein
MLFPFVFSRSFSPPSHQASSPSPSLMPSMIPIGVHPEGDEEGGEEEEQEEGKNSREIQDLAMFTPLCESP